MNRSAATRVLLIQPNETVVFHTQTMLVESGERLLVIETEQSVSCGVARLTNGEFDAAILDIVSADEQALNGPRQLEELPPGIPLIVLIDYTISKGLLQLLSGVDHVLLDRTTINGSLLMQTVARALT